jgi:hypothetical protein
MVGRAILASSAIGAANKAMDVAGGAAFYREFWGSNAGSAMCRLRGYIPSRRRRSFATRVVAIGLEIHG